MTQYSSVTALSDLRPPETEHDEAALRVQLAAAYRIFDYLGWTIETEDGSLSAQFEHTLWVTDSGCEILTELSTD